MEEIVDGRTVEQSLKRLKARQRVKDKMEKANKII